MRKNGQVDPNASRVIRKYVDWAPKEAGAGGPFIDTEYTATVPGSSRVFSGGGGIIYVATKASSAHPKGQLLAYKDRTSEGGELLSPWITYQDSPDTPWADYLKIWTDLDGRILALDASGKIRTYLPSQASTSMPNSQNADASDSFVAEAKKATEVWSAYNKVFTLAGGVVKEWSYTRQKLAFGLGPKISGGSLILTSQEGIANAWSPGPGTIYTRVNSGSDEGRVSGYAGALMEQKSNEAMVGMYAHVFADTAPCLGDITEVKPSLGEAAEDPNIPQATTDETPETVQSPNVFSGRFVLGNGQPAAGLPVRVEATDIEAEIGVTQELPTLGNTVTASDGTWSLPLPSALPPGVKEAAEANGGVINASASAVGVTSTGTVMRGVNYQAAAPASASPSARQSVFLAAQDGANSSSMLPVVANAEPEPDGSQYEQSWGSQQEQAPVDNYGDSPLPTWQSATADLPSADPYMINGTDTKSMILAPYKDGGCDKTGETVISKNIYYTTVGEGHAYWDAKASVDYDSKLSSTVDAAVKTGSNWAIQGSTTLGSSISVTTGFTNKGPYFAKQWKVPIEYKKIEIKWKCGKNNNMSQYAIRAGKYKVPSGGATGKYGADVRSKDGYKGWNKSPKANRAYVSPGSYFQISKNRSAKWSIAATAYGVSLGASTQYDRDHKQRITAGDYKNAKHYIWGKNGPVSSKPGILYSY
ncbi:hypothetical protein ACFWNC_02875 [Streptomyces sp. NPDC058369]|uniref:hypothetical protein n=1 Tax=Streptomyces sp. NPDC058369 TaxID=3346462 RepID=UPI00364D841D